MQYSFFSSSLIGGGPYLLPKNLTQMEKICKFFFFGKTLYTLYDYHHKKKQHRRKHGLMPLCQLFQQSKPLLNFMHGYYIQIILNIYIGNFLNLIQRLANVQSNPVLKQYVPTYYNIRYKCRFVIQQMYMVQCKNLAC